MVIEYFVLGYFHSVKSFFQLLIELYQIFNLFLIVFSIMMGL